MSAAGWLAVGAIYLAVGIAIARWQRVSLAKYEDDVTVLLVLGWPIAAVMSAVVITASIIGGVILGAVRWSR